MSTIINTRSPFYKKITNSSLHTAKLELYIWTGVYADRAATDKRYTLTKEEIGGNNFVTYELSKLIRDYMITEYNNYSTDSLWVDAVVEIRDSNNAIAQILTGQTKFIVPYKFGYVDVRDVAEAHIMAMQNSSSNGKRFPLVSKDLRHKEIIKILKENGFKDLPKFSIPIFLTICLGIFKKELRPDLKFIINTKSIKKSTIAKDILGWKPRLAEDSILEVARYVKNKKF